MKRRNSSVAASRTQLPPSPELRGLPGAGGGTMGVDDFTLAAAASSSSSVVSAKPYPNTQPSWNRLQCIARYETFQPTALACSPPLSLSSTSTDADAAISSSSSTPTSRTQQPQQQDSPSWTSLGALSGSKGVALFRVSAPQTPLLVLSHTSSSTTTSAAASSPTKNTSGIRAMEFQPTCSHNSLSLAAARGNGILVWDVSGHSLNPLAARLGTPSSASSQHPQQDRVVSLSWYMGSESSLDGNISSSHHHSGNPWLLASTTPSCAFLWDLREPSSSSSHGSFPSFAKPSLRFGGSPLPQPQQQAASIRNGGNNYVQLACSSENSHCALLDANGTVRIFDLRMAQQHDQSPTTAQQGSALVEFRAHDCAGIGLSYLPSRDDNELSRWVTWGVDSVASHPVVRIWNQQEPFANEKLAKESTLESSPDDLVRLPRWNMAAECEVPNLACARVFGADSIVMVSQETPLHDRTSYNWNMDVWKTPVASSHDNVADSFVKRFSFEAREEAQNKVSSMLGPQAQLGGLCASELAMSSIPRIYEGNPTLGGQDDDYSFVEKRDDLAVLVLGLTDTGFLTTHAIPEVVPLEMKSAHRKTLSQSSAVGDALTTNLSSQYPARVYPDRKESMFGDIAGAWSTKEERPNKREISGSSLNQGVAEGQMQFDLDVAAVFSSTEDERPSFQVGTRQDATDGSPTVRDDSVVSSRNTARLMEKIDTQNIPCPRLCGATFGPGVGGLVQFHNGEVRKMWRWYSGEMSSMPRRHLASQAERERSGTSEYPIHNTVRTLKDLFDMTKASKESQWGVDRDDSDASSIGSARLGENFFEDSDESEDDDDSDSGEGSRSSDYLIEKIASQKAKDRMPGKSGMLERTDSYASAHEEDAVLPSSHVLTPHVLLNQNIDVRSFNRQSPALAKELKLGNWAAPSTSKLVSGASGVLGRPLSNTSPFPSDEGSLSKYDSSGRPHNSTMPNVSSDPHLTVRTTHFEDERSVHGGAYAVRPGMQEPVEFLRKLFTHQQGLDSSGFSGLLPPDKRLLPNTRSAPRFRQTPYDASLSTTQHRKPGVYTFSPRSMLSAEARTRLSETRYLCSHNAEVCREMGELQKADVWSVLTQIVDGRIAAAESKSKMWIVKAADALASNFISSTLRFFESSGDVQMLATMVCVLRTQTQELPKSDRSTCTFLPLDHSGKYDSYIRIYASLLYAWGLLSPRVELNKHLRPQWQESATMTEFKIVPSQCIVCGDKNANGSMTCASCNDFMFRCVICENAVKGFFTWCNRCGHGGHTSHMMEFFQVSKECPTGCGCQCVLSSSKQEPD